MESERVAITGVITIIIIAGFTLGVSLFAFQDSANTGTTDDSPLTGIVLDQDLLELGLQVPSSWSFEMSDGTTLKLSDLNGTIILVDLMATWCSSCATENTYLNTVYENLAGPLAIISLSVDISETPSMLADYKSVKGLAWDHGVDSSSYFTTYFGITNIPSLVLIDGDGYFRFYHIGLWSAASISDVVGMMM
jgi:thiol-disulfide isomerase/thioredoxin